MKQQDSKAIVASKYSEGVYSLYDVFKLVSIKYLTKEEFHQITSFNYDGVKQSMGW